MIIPSYNLSNVIQASVENIIKNIQLITNSFEIIIVNDGSVDNTLDIIENLKKKYDFIRTISYSQNQGKGYAVRKGILESVGSSVMFIDGDSDIGTDSIKNFIQELKKLDKNKSYYVYCRTGSRSANTCVLMKEMGFSKTYNLLGGITEWEGEIEGQNK